MGGKRGWGDTLRIACSARSTENAGTSAADVVVDGLRQDGSAATRVHSDAYTVPFQKGTDFPDFVTLTVACPQESVWACHGTFGRAVHSSSVPWNDPKSGAVSSGNADLQQPCGLVERANLQRSGMAADAV